MKRATSILLAFVLVFMMAVPGFSQLRRDRDFFIGKIVAVNEKAKEVTIYDYNSRVERTFTVEVGWEHAVVDNEVVVNALKGSKICKALRKIVPRKKK